MRGWVELVSLDREEIWAQSTVQATGEQEFNNEPKKPGCPYVASRLSKEPAV